MYLHLYYLSIKFTVQTLNVQLSEVYRSPESKGDPDVVNARIILDEGSASTLIHITVPQHFLLSNFLNIALDHYAFTEYLEVFNKLLWKCCLWMKKGSQNDQFQF